MPRSRLLLFIILLAGFIVRVVFTSAYQRPPVSDEAAYDQLANSIVNTGGYAIDGVPTAYRSPGYPGVLALSYSLFGHSVLAAKIIQALLDTLTAYFLFCLGRVRSPIVGLISASMWAVFLPAILYANLLLTESITAFFLTAAALVFVSINGTNRGLRLIVFGLLMGVSVLFKPSLLLLPLVLFVFYTRISIQPRDAVPILAGILVIIVPWMIRNQLVLGSFALSTNTGMNLYIGNNPDASGAYRGVFPVTLADAALTETARNEAAMRAAKEYVISNPGVFFLNGAKKLAHLFRSEGDVLIASFAQQSDPMQTGFIQRYLSVPLPLTILTNISSFTVLIVGLAGFLAGKRDRAFWFTASLLLALLASHFVFFGGSRFHFVLMPFAVLYASEAFVLILQKEFHLTGRKQLVLVSIFFALSAIWSYELFTVFTAN